MSVKTITAEIDGQVRRITADIPDGASQADIMSAVEEWSKSHAGTSKGVPGMEKLGALPSAGARPTKKELEGPPNLVEGSANLPPRDVFEKATDWMTLGASRKFREGLEELAPGSGEKVPLEQGFRGARHLTEAGLTLLTPKAMGAALETVGAAPNVVLGLMRVAKPYFWGMAAAAGAKTATRALGAPEEASRLAGEIAGAGVGVAKGALEKKTVKAGNLPKLPGFVKYALRKTGWGDELIMVYEHAQKTGEIPSAPPARPGLKPPKFGGSYSPEAEATPGTRIPRKNPAETPRTTPYPRGKGTKTAYGGSTEEYGGPSYKMARKKLPGPSSPKGTESGKVQSMPQTSTIDTGRVAARLKEAGIGREQWENATPKQKKDILAMFQYVGGMGEKALKDISRALD